MAVNVLMSVYIQRLWTITNITASILVYRFVVHQSVTKPRVVLFYLLKEVSTYYFCGKFTGCNSHS